MQQYTQTKLSASFENDFLNRFSALTGRDDGIPLCCCLGADGAGKTTAVSATCALLQSNNVSYQLLNARNPTFPDPILAEMFDYNGRILFYGNQDPNMTVPASMALADALRFNLIRESLLNSNTHRYHYLISDAWSHMRFIKHLIQAEKKLNGYELEDRLVWLLNLFAPTLSNTKCFYLMIDVDLALRRKQHETTNWDVGVFGKNIADTAGAFVEYQTGINAWLNKLSRKSGSPVIFVTNTTTATEVGEAFYRFVTNDNRDEQKGRN